MAVNRTKVLEAAQKFLSKGQYDKAIAEYQKLVSEDPRDVRTLLKIGDLHTRRNKPKDAIDVYHKVAELYAKQGFFLKAVAVYKQILKLDPTHIDSSQKLAKMYEELALTSDALTTYEAVADAYLAQGQAPKALEIMERMVELDPQNVAVRIKYAEALSKADRAKEAAKAFAEGAHLLKEQGRMDDYIRVIERQLYHDPESLDIARELSSLYLERSDPKRALAKLQICFKADPRDIQTLEMLAEAFRQLGQIPKTISVLKEISRLHGEVGAQEPRRRTLKRVLDLDPNDAEAKQAIAQIAGPGVPRTTQAGAPVPTKPSPTASQARPQPAPARAPIPSPLPPVPESDDIDLDADSDFDMLDQDDGDDDQVLIVDEQPPEPVRAPAQPARSVAQAAPQPAPARAAPSQVRAPEPESESKQDKIARLLGQADSSESNGRYEAAESALKQVLTIENEHLPTHERLKDLYLATDRRVDAVRELLWLSDAWTERNPERAIQYAKAAYDLAPNAEQTKNRLRGLGIDPERERQEEVMFVDDSKSEMFDEPHQDAEAELDAILPPVSDSSLVRSSDDRVLTRDSEERLPRTTSAREPGRAAVEDPLDVPLSPDDFDAPPPARRAPSMAMSMMSELLDRPMSPEDFEGDEPDRTSRGSIGDDEMASLLDAPISPDEFDAPPPRREVDRGANVDALLDAPGEPDDFGLSDPRFDRSGLIDVESAPIRGASGSLSSIPAGRMPRVTPAEMLDDDDEPSIEFAEIGTGEIDLADTEAHEVPPRLGPGDYEPPMDREAPVTLAPAARSLRPRDNSDFSELNTGELMLLADEAPAPKAKEPPAFVPSMPAPARAAQPPRPPLPDLDDGASDGPDATVPGAPIPDLIRRSQQADGGLAPQRVPSELDFGPVGSDDAESLFGVPESIPAQPVAELADEPDEAELLFVAPDDEEQAPAFTPATAPATAARESAPQVTVQSAVEAIEAVAPEIEEVLDEADFFASQGLMDEALEVVQEAILIYPSNKALRQRLLDYEAKADEQEAEQEAAQENKAVEIADDSFDIAQQLAQDLSDVPAPTGIDEMIDVESVFAQFKKGVAQQISPEDSETHFDLGIAYKEMGLIDDAMSEFELAAHNPKRACTALSMVGMCCLEKGDAIKAVGYFERALATELKAAPEELALLYEIGNAHEMLGNLDKAISAFEKVMSRERTFRGVGSRLDQLKKRGGKSLVSTR